MSEDELTQAKLAEYQQRRKVELLRQELYAQPDPSASPEILQELFQAEKELWLLEEERIALEGASGRGLLIAPGEAGSVIGAEIGGSGASGGIEAQVLLRMSHVPTGIVHLLSLDESPLVTFRIHYTGERAVRLRLTSYVEGYSAQTVDTVELLTGDFVEKHQLPTFFPERLETVTEMTRATLHICIDDLDRRTAQESTFPIWLLARTSAYLGIEDPATGEWIDLTPYLAAWVTPNAPEVTRLLRKAAELHSNRRILGYQVGPDGVEEQVKAIYDAVKAEGIVYINSVLSFGARKGEQMQRVRLPRECIADKSANCIDGTVLMASILEAATLNPALVILPGHALLAWETQNANGEWKFLETTMIGTHDFEKAQQAGQVMCERQRALAEQLDDPRYFSLLALPRLRVEHGIMPME